jgi:hypothetical protein
MGAAWAALHGGYRGNKYEGPDRSAAIAKLKKRMCCNFGGGGW